MLSFNLKSNKKIILAIFLLILISLLIVALIFINTKSKISQNSSQIDNSKINAAIIEVDKKITPEDKKSIQYFKAKELFNKAATSKTDKEKYDNFKAATTNLQLLYTITHHSYLRSLVNDDLAFYAKSEFPDLFQESVFNYPCQDQSCAQSKTPQEISAIAEEIKASDLPTEYKQNYSENLINTSFESDSDTHSKAWQYISTAYSLENSSDLSPSGANLVIADKIKEFVKKTYPEDFILLEKAKEESDKNMLLTPGPTN